MQDEKDLRIAELENRVRELTQRDPSCYDMSAEDAFKFAAEKQNKVLELQQQLEEANTRAEDMKQRNAKLREIQNVTHAEIDSLISQLTAEREAHAVTRKALEEADGALFKASDWADAHSYGYLPEFEAALAREEARKKEVRG